MKRILVTVVVVLLCVLSGCTTLNAPVFSVSHAVVGPNGQELTVHITEHDFPDQEISVVVQTADRDMCHFAGFANYLSDYDYQRDFRDSWNVVVDTYNQEEVSAYRFYWGVVVTTDGGDTYELIPKHTYETRRNESKEVRAILERFGI